MVAVHVLPNLIGGVSKGINTAINMASEIIIICIIIYNNIKIIIIASRHIIDLSDTVHQYCC